MRDRSREHQHLPRHWVRIALEQPFNAEPGALWQYNRGGVIAIGAAVASATGTPFYAYASERLFSPLL